MVRIVAFAAAAAGLSVTGCTTLEQPTAAAPVIAAAPAPLVQQSRPNIVFIMSDDHAYQAVSAYESDVSRIAPTPNIDRIAQRGALFENSYVTNSLCGPSRATMLTGQFSHMHGFTRNGQKYDNSRWNWPRALGQSGYQTALFGKWHLNYSPEGAGFDTWKVLDDQGKYYNPDVITPTGRSAVEGYATDIVTDQSLHWLEQERDPDRPFALLIHHKAPHRNFMPAIRHLQKYLGTEFPVPTNYFDHYDGRRAADAQEMNIYRDMFEGHDLKMTTGVGSKELRENPWKNDFERMTPQQRAEYFSALQPSNDAMNAADMSERDMALWKYQRYMSEYLGTVAAVDDSVGRVLDWLETNGLDENTIVVYTSDQGFYLGEHGWFDKRFMYEESLRTPLLIQYPGHIAPGTRVTAPVQNVDYAPTFLELAGLAQQPSIQGRTLREVFDNSPPADWREDIYYHYYEYPGFHAVRAHYGVRTERYKLIRFYGDINAWEFYDLQADPAEMHNRIDDPKVRSLVADLKQRLEGLRARYQDDSGPAVDAPLALASAMAKGRRDAEAAAGAGHHAH
ncbi:sulfatase family protein [Allopontixanthobacter sediminis]|uniref:Sulfatase-like hydrolase/transferase n=1 Tax=Allopontixanthobacter sediminis TaxID=1689985 RepID=A0A845B4H7_9SPHN|nr:sulfatase [Allopontixanthobacter sediminis]MXP45575.1 sulfatase-like hydrolase/transferase [Allopontixanthobacter sediminis]